MFMKHDMVFLFTKNIVLPLCQMIFSRKNKLKDDISSIIEKDDTHPKKYGISSDKKIKDN